MGVWGRFLRGLQYLFFGENRVSVSRTIIQLALAKEASRRKRRKSSLRFTKAEVRGFRRLGVPAIARHVGKRFHDSTDWRFDLFGQTLLDWLICA